MKMLQGFQQWFEKMGFNPATSAVLAVIMLFLYDLLWYPYYASYLLPFLIPALSGLSGLAALMHLRPAAPGPVPAAALSPGDRPIRRPTQHVEPNLAALPLPTSSVVPSGGSSVPVSTPTAPAHTVSSVPAPSAAISYAIPGLVPPGVSFGPKSTEKSSESAVDTVAAVAAARGAVAAQARRRLRGKNKAEAGGRRHEYLEETAGMGATATADVPAYAATGRGTGPSASRAPRRSQRVHTSPQRSGSRPMRPGR